jgi:basic membrane protein A
MRTRSIGLSLLATLALVVSACNNGASTAPSTGTQSQPASSEAASTNPATPAPSSSLKIGVVTDVGTVDDKNFNQYSYEGAQKGATDIGAPAPQVTVPKDSSEYAADIQAFIDQGYNIIVTVGFNLTNDTAAKAKANPDVWFIGVDQAPCVDENGDVDATFACKGDAAKLLPKYIGLQYQEDQAGYLAGIVAGSLSLTKTKTVGAIGGINLVPAVVRYIQGYQLGAQSVDASIQVKTAYVSTSDFGVAFNDPGTGKTFANQFIQTNHPDVLFQVAGKTGNGVLEAACAAGIYGVGVDVDQWNSLSADTTPTYNCIVTSAEKHLSVSVEQTINAIAGGSAAGGILHFNASNDGIGASAEHDGKGLITSDIQAKLDAALAAMKAGTLTTCPATCGQP